MIKNVQLGTSETIILQTSTGKTNAVLSILFCNLDTTSRIFTVYAYPSGGSAGDTTTILKEISISAKDTFIWTGDEKIILSSNDVISGICDSASKITVTINYYTL